METVIQFTLYELIQLLMWLCGAVITVAGAIGVVVAVVKKVKSPNQLQDERLDQIDKRLDNHDKLLGNDNTRLKDIEGGNKVTQKALLALLAHGIDGNDVEAMKKAKAELEQYLINK